MKINKIIPLIETTVPSRLILLIGTYFVGILFFLVYPLPIFNIILFLVIISIADSASSTLNSIFDIDIDKNRHEKRPIISGRITRNEALTFFIFLTCLSLSLSLFVNFYLFVIVCVRILLEILYSTFRWKRYFFINHLITGMTYCLLPLLASWVLFINNSSFPLIFLFFFILAILLSPLKDIDDYETDKKNHINNFVVFFGKLQFYKIFTIYMLITFLLFIFSIFLKFFSYIYLYPTFLSLFLVYLFSYYLKKYSHQQKTKIFGESLFTKISIFFAIIILFIYGIFFYMGEIL